MRKSGVKKKSSMPCFELHSYRQAVLSKVPTCAFMNFPHLDLYERSSKRKMYVNFRAPRKEYGIYVTASLGQRRGKSRCYRLLRCSSGVHELLSCQMDLSPKVTEIPDAGNIVSV